MLNGLCLAESWKRRAKTSTGSRVPAGVPLRTCRNNCKSFTAARSSSPIAKGLFPRVTYLYLGLPHSLAQPAIKLKIRLVNRVLINHIGDVLWGVEGYLFPSKTHGGLGVGGDCLLTQPSRTQLSKSACRDWGLLSCFIRCDLAQRPWILLCPLKHEERNIKYRPKERPFLLAACPCEAFQFFWSQHHPTVCLIFLGKRKCNAMRC